MRVVVNQDESEFMKTLENPFLRCDTDFERDLEIAGIKREMHSMLDFDAFCEERVDQLTQEQLGNAICAKWAKTRKPDGCVRCRLVIHGFDQKSDQNVDDTFASTPSLATLKLLLTLAASFNWTVTCGDISTAFLYALITRQDLRVIFCEFYPAGNVVWKLERALYGLRNAPQLWQDHFASVMAKNNCRRMKSDPNLYARNDKRLFILCYVGDLMLLGHSRMLTLPLVT